MYGFTRGALLSLVLVLFAAPLAAQGPVMIQPEPLDPAHPHAVVANGLVQGILTGDAAAAEALLREKAAPALLEGGALASQLSAVMQAVGSDGKYQLDGIDRAGPGMVIARLLNSQDESWLGIVVDVEPEAPHRVRGIRSAQLQINRGPDGP